jgi:hypothetical protein
VCLVGERSRADPRFRDGSNHSQVWLEMLGWIGSDPLFCLVGGIRYGLDVVFTLLVGPTCHRVRV